MLCAVRRVVARRGLLPGPDVWLLLRRNPATDELKCYLSNGPADMAPERLVWLAGLRPWASRPRGPCRGLSRTVGQVGRSSRPTSDLRNWCKAFLRWPSSGCLPAGAMAALPGPDVWWVVAVRHATLVMLAHFFVVRETLRRIAGPATRPPAGPMPNAVGGTASTCSGNMKFRCTTRTRSGRFVYRLEWQGRRRVD